MSRQADSFDALYRRHAPSAFRRAERLLGAADVAHEVVHDVFLSLLERPAQYEGRSSMSTFLYSAVTHACLNRLRDDKNRRRLLQLNAQAVPLPSAPQESTAEEWTTLRARLARLPDGLAQVAVYYYFDELSHEEIARLVGCSRSHVGDLLQRLQVWTQQEEGAA